MPKKERNNPIIAWIKRLIGGKRCITWLVSVILAILWFVRLYYVYDIKIIEVVILGIFIIWGLMCLKLIQIEEIDLDAHKIVSAIKK